MEELHTFLPPSSHRPLACGYDSTSIVTKEGKVYFSGRVTDDRNNLKLTPHTFSLPSQSPVTMIVRELHHGVILLQDGSVWAWEKETMDAPSRLVLPQPAISIATEAYHTLILLCDGSVYGYGDNVNGRLGIESYSYMIHSATKLPIPGVVTTISISSPTSLVLLEDGSVWGCGANFYGKLGLGHYRGGLVCKFSRMILPQPAIGIASSYGHSLVILQGGSVWGCGDNNYHQLGLNGVAMTDSLLRITLPHPAIKVICYTTYSAVLLENGDVLEWGMESHQPTKLTTPEGLKAVDIAFGHRYIIARLEDGSYWGRGINDKGQLGVGNTISQPQLVKMD